MMLENGRCLVFVVCWGNLAAWRLELMGEGMRFGGVGLAARRDRVGGNMRLAVCLNTVDFSWDCMRDGVKY